MKQLTESENTIEEIALVMKALFSMCQDKGIIVQTGDMICSGDPITEVDVENKTIILW